MSLYSYQIFEKILQQGSFAKSAEVLNLTPSAVSHIVAKLEDEIGLQLFARSKGGVKLSGNGEKLLPYITELLRSYDRLEQQIAQIHGLEGGVVRIGTFNSITVQWLSQILHVFRSQHPQIEIQIYQGTYQDMVDWINGDIVDISFISATVLQYSHLKDAEVIPLYDDRMTCVTPPEFKAANPEYVTIDDIKNYPLIMQKEAYDQEAVRILDKYNLSSRSAFRIAEDDGIIAMVSAGFGVCILPELVVMGCNGNFNTYPFSPAEYRTICLIVNKPRFPVPAVELMKSHIVDFAKDYTLLHNQALRNG